MSINIFPYLYLRFLLFLLLIALFSLLCYPRDKFQKFKCSIRFHYSVPCRMFSLNFNILKQENKIKERIVMIFFNITFLPYPYTTRISTSTVCWYFSEHFSVLSYYFFLKVERSYFKLITCFL